MTPRPRRLPSTTVRALLVPALAVVAVGLAACGGDDGDAGTTSTTVPPATTRGADAPRLSLGDAKEAAGTVSVCGATSAMRLLRPAIRRFDGVSERLQASTLGFPDGEGRPLRAFRERQRAESRDCDLYVAAAADEIPALAADGDLYDLARAVKGWTAAPGAAPLRPVLDGERAFGVPVRADDATGVMVLSVHGRNPGGGLEVLRALADARLVDD